MVKTYTLNHFGIVASTCKELKIAEMIDELIPPDPQQVLTTGQAVVSMIINGLGFSNRRLYLFPQFFENKPVKLLVANNVSAEHLNDDTIGRALDRIFDYGCTDLFCYVAHKTTEQEHVNRKYGHLDSTTFSLHGEYSSDEDERVAIKIVRGHPKSKRPDLNQIFLNLMVCDDGGVPLFMQTLDGNSSDSVTFRNNISAFKNGLKKNFQELTYYIADCKFYTAETLKITRSDLLWISRVPDNIKDAKDVIEDTGLYLAKSIDRLKPLNNEGYSYHQYCSCFADVKQRWLVVHSKENEKRANKTVLKAVNKELKLLNKMIKKEQKIAYCCEIDAKESMIKNKDKFRFHSVIIDKIITETKYPKRGRPSKSKSKNLNVQMEYYPCYKIEQNNEAIQLEIKKRAIFIIATNELSEQNLSDQDVFDHYKGQVNVEKGFRFLKDPLFFASSLFLKKPERIVALTMAMCLSLLVYSLCERKLRKSLKEHDQKIKNRINKPSQRPTLKWIFELFEDVHLVELEDGKNTAVVTNLRPEGEKALRILGKDYLAPYLLSEK